MKRTRLNILVLAIGTLSLIGLPLLMLPGCQTPPDRIALSTLQTADASLDAAYRSWVESWKDRHAKVGDTESLLAERAKVAELIGKYQAAHRAALHAAEIAIQSTNGIATLSLQELFALKGELLDALKS